MKWDAALKGGAPQVQEQAATPPQASGLLRGLALLAGTVGGSSLARQLGRSGLDLPLGASAGSVSQAWLDEARLLQPEGCLPVWALVDGSSTPPTLSDGLAIRRDNGDLRGAGGALRDLAAEIGPQGRILVIAGGQAPLMSIADVHTRLGSSQADIVLLDGPQQAAGSILLASCEALASMRSVGFVDLKEQGLPELAARFEVRVERMEGQVTLPLRTRDQYIDALRRLARGDSDDALAERWRSAFAIIEPGADVAESAKLCDSVALRGARIGAGATVVRSVVAGELRPGATAVDTVIGPGDRGGAS